MIEITAGQAIINSKLPKEFRDYTRIMDKKRLSGVLEQVAKKYPGKYKETIESLKKIGQKVAYLAGSSISLDDFKPPIDRSELFQAAKDIENGKIKQSEIADKFIKIKDDIEKKSLETAAKNKNTMALMIISGARGKPEQFSSTVTSPVMYVDHKKRPIAMPIIHSLAEGLTPAEFFAMSYGARRGAISTKFATPKAGYYNKQVGYVTGNMLCVEEDCHTNNGLKYKTDDKYNIGRILALPAGGYPAGTIITKEILSSLIKKEVPNIVLRSPTTCQAEDGICQKCYGFNEHGTFPALGDNIGHNSAAALTEPFTQGMMSEKHTGGTIQKRKAGFEALQQILKVPKEFAGGSVVSEVNGKVEKIEEASQGGYFIYIDGEKHYVLPGYSLKVKVGDIVEKGTPLSSGIVNPSDITRLRGIGEGRKFLANSLNETYKEDGKDIDKKHSEMLARAMLGNVKLSDNKFFDNYYPGEIVSLNSAQKYYNPSNVNRINTKEAIDKYLTKPYLHYTIGTKITKNIAEDLLDSNIKEIEVSSEEPPFSPIMIRMDDVPAYKDNWLDRMYSVELKEKMLESIHRGEKVKLHSRTGMVPSLIYGVEFGKPKIGY